KKGFTLDKQTKKLRMWYLSQPTNLRYLHLLLREIGKEWVINEQFTGTEYYTDRTGVTTTMGSWLTKGLLEKILLNKITNPSDAAKYIIKANRLKGASPKFLQQYIKNKKPKLTLLMHNGYVTNINAVLQGANAVDSYTTGDLLKQAKA